MLREDYLMHSEIYVKSTSDISGDITLTDDYLVIKGGHYNIMDWYVKKLQSDVAISTKDILSMGFITMNSKRVLVLSIIFMSIFLSVIRFISKVNTFIMIIMFICCLCCGVMLLYYHLKPYRYFRIVAKGMTVAVEEKYYDRKQLEYIISYWNNVNR